MRWIEDFYGLTEVQELLLLQAKSPQLELPWGWAACSDSSSFSREVLLLTKYYLINIVIPREIANGHDMEGILLQLHGI